MLQITYFEIVMKTPG